MWQAIPQTGLHPGPSKQEKQGWEARYVESLFVWFVADYFMKIFA